MLQGYFALVMSMLIWGSVGIFVRQAGQDPLVTVTYRVLFAGATLSAVAFLQRRFAQSRTPKETRSNRLSPRQWVILALTGLCLATNWLFFFKAVETTSVSNAVLSYYAAPVMVALTSPILLHEALERRTMVATAMAFGGVFMMLYQPGQALRAVDVTGILYGLTAACFYAAVTIGVRRLQGVDAVKIILAQCLVAALVLIPVLALRPAADGKPAGLAALAVPAGALALLAVVGVVHTAVALFLYFRALHMVKVQHVGVLAYLDPVSAVIFAYLFLGEVPAVTSAIGGGLVLAGSALLLKRQP